MSLFLTLYTYIPIYSLTHNNLYGLILELSCWKPSETKVWVCVYIHIHVCVFIIVHHCCVWCQYFICSFYSTCALLVSACTNCRTTEQHHEWLDFFGKGHQPKKRMTTSKPNKELYYCRWKESCTTWDEKQPCKWWDKLPTSTGEFTGFLNHQQ